MEFRVLGQLEVDRSGANVAAGLVQAALAAGAAADPRQRGGVDRPDHRRAVGGRASTPTGRTRCGFTSRTCGRRSSPTARSAPRARCCSPGPPATCSRSDPTSSTPARFEQLVAEGRGLLDVDPAAASIVLGEGLGLWRGRPYEDVTYESFAQAEIGRLEELRLEAVELRIDADLRRGLAAELIGELESLARQHPLRERFTEQLMVALYRSGRQAEALRAFGRLRIAPRRGAGHRAVGVARAPWRSGSSSATPSLDLTPARGRLARPGWRFGATSCASSSARSDLGTDLSGLPAGGGSRGGGQGDPARAGQRPRVHPPLRGRGRAGRPARAPPHRPPVRLLAGAGCRLPGHRAAPRRTSLADAGAERPADPDGGGADGGGRRSAWRSPTAAASSTARHPGEHRRRRRKGGPTSPTSASPPRQRRTSSDLRDLADRRSATP